VTDPAAAIAFVAVGELHAIVSQDGVDFIRHGFDQNPQKGGGRGLSGFPCAGGRLNITPPWL
jgi:hypothetical protein